MPFNGHSKYVNMTFQRIVLNVAAEKCGCYEQNPKHMQRYVEYACVCVCCIPHSIISQRIYAHTYRCGEQSKSIPHHNPCIHISFASLCLPFFGSVCDSIKIHTVVWNCVQFTFVPSSQLTQKSTTTTAPLSALSLPLWLHSNHLF